MMGLNVTCFTVLDCSRRNTLRHVCWERQQGEDKKEGEATGSALNSNALHESSYLDVQGVVLYALAKQGDELVKEDEHVLLRLHKLLVLEGAGEHHRCTNMGVQHRRRAPET
jgi:hypothetical protein